MRIGIDIDDTITDTYDATIKTICRIYNVDYNELTNKKWNYDILVNKYPKVFEPNVFKKEITKEKLKENVKQIINKLSKEHEIIFITARNKKECEIPYNLSYNYLTKKGIKFNDLFVEVFDKGTFCYENKIDLFIDDSIRNCLSVSEYGIGTIIFDNLFNKNCDFKRYNNWLDIYSYIERINDGKNSN